MTTTRRYDIDALRAIAFLVLIFYHIGMFYVADWGWHVKSAYQSEWLKFPMILVNQWRMPLLFLISGLASSFLLRKLSVCGFIKTRTFRLLLPFTVGVLLIVPPQAYLQALSNGSIVKHFGDMSYSEFLWHYFTFQGWPSNAFDGSAYGFTWNHLWFIPYLLVYTLLLVPLRAILHYSRLESAFNNLGAAGLIVLPVLLQILWQVILNDEQGINHSLINDSYAHALFLTFFMLGYLISDKAKIWASIIRLRWFTLLSAIVSYCSLISLWWVFNETQWQDHLAGVVATFNQWLWLLAVLGWAATYLNKPAAWLSYANNRVYPWYIFHQTLTVAAGYFLKPFALGGLLEFSLLSLITMGGCLLLTEMIIARSVILSNLFGKKPDSSGTFKISQ